MNRARFAAILAEELGQAFVYSYFDRSGFTEGANAILYPWSLTANDKFRNEARDILKREGVKLGPPICEHLKPKPQRAA